VAAVSLAMRRPGEGSALAHPVLEQSRETPQNRGELATVQPATWRVRTQWRARRLWSRMPPKSRFYARTTQYRSERAAIIRRTVPLLLALAALVGFAVMVGYELQGTGKKSSNPLGVGQPLRALAVTLTRPAVSLPLAVALLALSAWLFRRVRLAWLVWWGGPVLVSDFKAGSELSTVKAPQMTALFRERLAVLRLQSGTSSPGAPPAGTFVDILTSGDTSSGSVLAVLLRLLRAAVPAYAIELQGAIREHNGQCCVTVQVLQTPSQPGPVVQVREASWERAIRMAADEATAAILPRSRLCVGPWAAWRGYVMPRELLSAYEDASEHEQERRFDQALDRYWEALRHDPMNLTIRLQLGQLQEKAGLFLAALTSYERILAFGNPGDKNLPRGLYRRAARREWDRAMTLAKYRAIIMLGEGSIVQQWSETPGGEQISYREKLHKEFCEVLGPLTTGDRRDPAVDAISTTTKELLKAECSISNEEEQQVREKLMDGAGVAADELKLSLSRLELRPSRRPVTRRTVALAQVCIERRRALMNNEHLDCESLRLLNGKIRGAGWRPGPWAGWWPPRLRRWQWHEHYNAACAYSIPLNMHYPRAHTNHQSEKVTGELVRSAIKRLEQAITIRESKFVVTWRDWVVSEDPDLDGLRDRPEFRAFLRMYFPSEGQTQATPYRSTRPYHLLAQSRYTRQLLAAIAACRHETWHQRAATRADLHRLLAWCEDDRELWHLTHKVAGDPYDWRIRQELLSKANMLHSGESPIQVKFTRHEDVRLIQPDNPDPAAQQERDLADMRIGNLTTLLKAPTQPGATNFARWIDAMHRFPVHPSSAMSHSRQTKLCNQHATVWHTLSEWLCAEDDIWATDLKDDIRVQTLEHTIQETHKRFAKQLRRTAKQWTWAKRHTRWRHFLREADQS
jgi:tetratricopeptide (TPR) repeat protein